MTSQTEQLICRNCEENRGVDEFGFPIDWVHKPVTKRCGHCRQKGHNKRTCPAFATTQKNCLVYPQESLASASSQEGSPNEGCMCLHCAEYRRLNLPTPEKAAQLIKRHKAEEKKKYADDRKSQVGSGDRSERIRTYNFPQSRLTDHRINYTSHSLNSTMMGDLDHLLEALMEHDQQARLENLHKGNGD